MDEQRDRRPILIVAGLLIGGLVMVSSLSLGGRVPTVLSKVGAAIGDPTQRGGPIDPTGGGTAATDGGAAAGSGSGTGGQVADAGTTIPSLLIVRTGQLELEVGDVTVGTAAADAAVLRAGGYISGSNRRVDVGDASATVAYRIPSATWQPTLDALHRLATQVRNEQVKTDEVSGQVVDLGARIANLRTTEAALQAIMAKAARISDILDVQEQLTITRGEIEKLIAAKARLVDQASFGSLVVTFRLPPTALPAATPTPAKGWDPGADVARATGKLVRIGQTTSSIGIWLAIVGLPLLIGGPVLAFVTWQVARVALWVVRRGPPNPSVP